jgi:hypothetical protein
MGRDGADSERQDLRQRLGRAVRIWREVSDAPLPRLDPDAPDKQLTALELNLVDLLADRADPSRAADVQFQLAELTEGRSDGDPVAGRVDAVLPMLRAMDERRSGRGSHPSFR